MGRFVDRIRARREMKNNPITISIDTDKVNEMTERMQSPTFVSEYKFDKPTERPQQIQDWQKYGFKSQDEMNFWVNRAKSWSGGVLDTIDKVKQFQKANGLADDGKVGWRTIDVFNRINGAGFSKPAERPQQVIPDWQKHGFKSQSDMDFWVNRAKSWTDGVFDTIDKVKQFQRAHGLVDDGKVGQGTIEMFNRINGIGQEFSNNSSSSNPGNRTFQSVQAENPRTQDTENTVADESYQYVVMPENTVDFLGRSVFTTPLSMGKKPANNNQAKTPANNNQTKTTVNNNQAKANNEPDNAEYPILSNQWFANTFSSLSNQNLKKVGRDILNFMTQKKEYKYNSPYSKEQSSNNAAGWANAYRSAGRLRNGGTIRRFQQGGELTPNDIESRLQYYSRIGYPVDGRIGDVNIGTISGEVPYTKYNAQTVKGANGMEMGQSDKNMRFIQYVKDCIGIQDDNSLKRAIQSLGEKGIKALQQAYKQGIPAQQVRKQLMGQQAQYAKRGGCLACQKNGGRFAKPSKPELQKANARANVNQMPVLVNSMKCGGKTGKKMLSKKRK